MRLCLEIHKSTFAAVQQFLAMAKGKVLVSHSDLDVLSRIYLLLIHKKYKAEATNKPEEIEQRIKRFKPDILIVGSNDYELIKEKLKKPAIVIADADQAKPTLNYGDRILKQPFQTTSLLQAVEELMF